MMSLNKIFLLTLIICLSHGRIPSIRLCGEPKCETIISTARTVINYQPSHSNHVAFRGNTPCRVMSKSIGDNSDLWEIEVQGRRGYAPKKMIMEQKILIKAADLVQVGTAIEPDQKDEVVENTTIPAELPDVPKADEQVIKDVVEPTSDASIQMDNVNENHQKEKEKNDDNDDDDEDKEDYSNQLPVDEPLAIKRDMYKTGGEGGEEQKGEGEVESEEQNISNENVDIHLEVVGLNIDEENAQKVEEQSNTASERPDKKLENQNEEKPHVTEEFVTTPEVTSKEQSEIQYDNIGDFNDQPPNENIKSEELPKVEEYQNNSEQYSDEIVTISNEIKDATITNIFESPLEPIEPVSDPISTSIPNSEISDLNRSQSYEDDKTLGITTIVSSESTSTHDINEPNIIDTKPDAENIPNISESSRIENSEESELKNESNEEYLANERKNEIPIYNIPPGHIENDSIEKVTDRPEASHMDIPESMVDAEQTQFAGIGNEESIEAIPSTENTVEQKPKIIEHDLNYNQEQLHVVDSELPSHPPSSADQIPENVVKTDDIFSPHFQPDSPPTQIIETEATNWYDGILIFVEDTYASMKKIFDKTSSESDHDKEESANVKSALDENGYCESMQGEHCPKTQPNVAPSNYLDNISKIRVDSKLVDDFLTQIVARADLVILLLLTAAAILIFLFGHYCLVNHRRESALIAQLNTLERKLLVSQKECEVTKADLLDTTTKLNNIANKSFGADDMIKQYEAEKKELCEQIASLEKELETAAEAGLELNKMVQELLSNQSGSDSIINSVEELQHQLNEQEANMIYINNLLAEKSRENSELQVLLSDTNQRFGTEIQELMSLNKQLEADKTTIEQHLNEKIHSLEAELKQNIELKSRDVSNLKEKYNDLKGKYDEVVSKWRTSAARAEALEETIKKMESFNGKGDIKSIIEATDANAKCIELKRENESLSDRLESELESKNRLQEQINELNEDITRLRAEFNQHEKDKLEAETRLEVLSNYFKEKESQLQKELNVKEALFMKQQGESTSTVDRIRSLQEDIQKLRSQNDELRAEIEAQSAAHKAQINAAEARAHDSWLAAKQAERRLEEARSEASILRKKLTSLSTFNGTTSENNFTRNQDGFIPELNAPSPIHLESPSSPVLPLMNLPPPPLIPPPIYSGMTPFMPPPPLPLPNEMRPAPLGRLMSPPPPDHRFMANFVEPNRYENNRYSPDDYPTDLYETETDFSPPRSPPRSPEFYRGRNYRNYSPEVPTKKKTNRKGTLSSESVGSRDRI